MKIREYIEQYTLGKPVPLSDVVKELEELAVEIPKLNKKGISEEFGDVIHFFQLWLYWRFGVNGDIWKLSQNSIDKFIDRKKVWQEIYAYVGLDRNISNFAGNYRKKEKVIKQLSQFGISREKAESAFSSIVNKQ